MTAAKPAADSAPVPAEPPTAPDQPKPAEQPKPGLILKSYRLSLKAIEKTSTGIGGTGISALGLIGLPKGPTGKMKRGQAKALRGVTQWSDDMGTHMAHGIGKSKSLAKQGGKKAWKGWKREMKFFTTLR